MFFDKTNDNIHENEATNRNLSKISMDSHNVVNQVIESMAIAQFKTKSYDEDYYEEEEMDN